MKLAVIPIILLSIISSNISIGQITWEPVNTPQVNGKSTLELGIGSDHNMYIVLTARRYPYLTEHVFDSLFHSSDGGISWKYIDYFKDVYINDIYFSSQNEIYIGAGLWMFGGDEGKCGIFYSRSGVNWEHLYKYEPGCGHVMKVFKNYERDLLAITDLPGALFQLTAAEEEWKALCKCDFVEGGCGAPYNEWDEMFGVNDLIIDTLNQYYISTTRGLFKSSDKGSSWTDLELKYEIQCTEIYDDHSIIAGTSKDGIFHFNYENDFWTNIGLKGREIRTIFSQYNSTLLVATLDSGVYYTNNNGNTWIQLNQGLDTTSILSMKIGPSGFFYISTGKKVYKSVESFEGIYNSTLYTEVSVYDNHIRDITIFPNPSEGNITIDISNPTDASLEIYNINGRMIYSKPLHSNQESVDFSSYPAGLYFFKVRQQGAFKVEKVVFK